MKLVWLAPLFPLLLAGCNAVGAIGSNLNGGAATAQPADFNTLPTATEPVETDELPPIDPNADPVIVMGPLAEGDEFGQPNDDPLIVVDPLAGPDELGQPNQTAVLAANSNVPVGFNDLIGGWTISLGSTICTQFFLNGTPWETGFRASTRDCPEARLSSISSWSLEGQEVVLYSESVAVARLYPVSIGRDGTLVVSARFEGQMIAGGSPVAFFR